MAKVVGIKDPLLKLDFSEIWSLQKATFLMKERAEENIKKWSQMLEKAVVDGRPDRVKMYQGFLSDSKRELAMAEQLNDALVLLDERRYKRIR